VVTETATLAAVTFAAVLISCRTARVVESKFAAP